LKFSGADFEIIDIRRKTGTSLYDFIENKAA